ncbi:MAG: hypothetical protein OXU86_00345 [Thaumarchaeota archaeon]|nr:hypothetical protein [Nitrososphaerota archaeon]
MAAQELQGRDGAGAEAMAAPGEDLARQENIFESRKDELLARHPGKFIAVCGDEVFVGDTDDEAVSRAEAAHPGRPFFLRMHYPEPGEGQDAGEEDSYVAAVDEAFEADIARQREFYEAHEDELLARHPGKSIGICAGEVFVGDDGAEVVNKADAAYPDRAVFISGREEFVGGW